MIGRGFSIEEYELRYKKIKKLMIDKNIDCILITTEDNFRYFGGLESQFWESPTRPMYLILSINHPKPIAIVPTLMWISISNTWLDNILTWNSPNDDKDSIKLLLNILSEHKNIGIPMDAETEIRMPLNILLQISKILNTEFIDASDIIKTVRNIKSDEEINKIRHICQIASDCFEELPKKLQSLNLPHITERIAVKEMHKLLIDKGADNVKYIVGKSGRDGYSSVVDGPTDKILLSGNVFVIDTGAIFDGYFCDFDRNYLIIDEDNNIDTKYTEHCNKLLWEATNRGISVAKHNNKFSDIWFAMVNYLTENGIDCTNYDQGRMGHCIGLQLTELPSITDKEDTLLKEGMVVSIEPFIETKNNKVIVHEECVVIKKDSCELLSKRCPEYMLSIKTNKEIQYDDLAVNIYNPLQKRLQPSDQTVQLIKQFIEKQEKCYEIHQKINNNMTPLINMKKLEKELGINEIIVKNEGERFGLKSFKVLGSSFAISILDNKPDILCTMTDGNHGKGVAYMASKLGIKCIIYVPKNMSKARKNAMKELGAEIIVVDGSYDDAIEQVKENAQKNNWCLVSDTSWDGYIDIPQNIMAGYGTIFREIEIQRKNCKPITHVVIQAGVGGLAGATCAWVNYYKNYSNVWADDVKILIVEPVDADCIAVNIYKYKNALDHELTSCVGKTDSLMAGLNCGKPSTIVWPIIRDIASKYISIGDTWAKIAMKKMSYEGIIAGESGGAGIACIIAAKSLFDKNSVILTINTESDTDPDIYKKIVE